MAARMAAVGRVSVSLRRSIIGPSAARRQGLYVAGDGGDVLVGQLARGVVDHLGHVRADEVALGRHAELEHGADVALAPLAESYLGVARQVGHPLLAELAPGEGAVLLQHAVEGPRRVAFLAMARALDQVGAAVPGGVPRRVGLEAL